MAAHRLYLASCVRGGGIYCYLLEENGRMTYRWKTHCEEPMYLCLSGNRMYALLRKPFPGSDESGLQTFSVGAEGRLRRDGEPVGTKGTEACHLSVFRGRVYAANYSSGSVFCSDGTLDQRSGHGVQPDRQEAPHPHFVAPSPDGRYLLSTDLGLDTVFTYDESLRVLSAAKTPAGHGPRHLAWSEDGKTVFCANELASTVTVFRCEDGALTPVQTVSALKEPCESAAAAIRVRGEYVYVSNRGDNSIACLRFDGSGLTLCSVTPCGGDFPRDFLIVDDLLLCANERSDTITVFRVKGAELERLPEAVPIPKPLCILAQPL